MQTGKQNLGRAPEASSTRQPSAHVYTAGVSSTHTGRQGEGGGGGAGGFCRNSRTPPSLPGSQVQCGDLLGATPPDRNSPSLAPTPPPGWEEPLPPAGSVGDSAGVVGPGTQLRLEGRAPGRWAPARGGCTSLQTHRSQFHVHTTGLYTPVLETSMERSLEPVGQMPTLGLKCPQQRGPLTWRPPGGGANSNNKPKSNKATAARRRCRDEATIKSIKSNVHYQDLPHNH